MSSKEGLKIPYINVNNDTYNWFQKARKIKLKDKRRMLIQENELLILMLNIWEAGNMGKQVSEATEDLTKKFPQKIFEHYNGKFYRDSG